MQSLALALCLVLQDAEPVPPTALHAELALRLEAAVDLATPREREQEARRLASIREARLEDWLALCADFRPRPSRDWTPGPHSLRVDLQVLDEVEDTELNAWIPASYDESQPAPLMLVLHGAGGNGNGLPAMWRASAEELGMLVIAPSEAGENMGYGFTDRERASTLSALRWARRQWNVDERRIFVSGISRGGHLAWDLILRYPDLFAGAAPMIGGPRLLTANGQNNVRFLEHVVGLPIRDLQGEGDDPILLATLRHVFEELEEREAPDAELILQAGHGHSFDLQAVDWPAFWGGLEREPVPRQLVRVASREDETRNAWVAITRFERGVEDDFMPTVRADTWNRLSQNEKLLYLNERALERNARVEIELTEPGRFTIRSERVDRLRLWLTPEMLDEDGKLRARWNGRTKRAEPDPKASVLLADFVERFDRSFLPVAEVELR